MKSDNCSICSWINEIKINPNYLIKELSTGYVVLSKYQYKYYRGYTVFICKRHVGELHELENDFKLSFLKEMSQAAEAVFKAFNPDKLNYEMLGNTEPHLHWHLFPRYKSDPNFKRPIWVVDKQIRQADSTIASLEEIKQLKNRINTFLDK